MKTGYENMSDERLNEMMDAITKDLFKGDESTEAVLSHMVHKPRLFLTGMMTNLPESLKFIQGVGVAIMGMAEKFSRERAKHEGGKRT